MIQKGFCTMKSHIKKLVPIFLLNHYKRLKWYKMQSTSLNKTTEEVFTEIYEHNKWGGSKGKFCSGPGSTHKQIVSAYINMISDKASSENFLGSSFIDLGCGDFLVGKKLIPLCSSYTGIDIVKSLVEHNQKKYGNEIINFMHLNIVEDELPTGDVCFVRQVLQHLNNQQISAILKKLKIYKWVFITEHYPTNNNNIRPNIDKMCGSDIRLNENSGVYFTEPPFILPIKAIEKVLEISVISMGKNIDPGVIVTFLYKPGE